jgi:hypothetical protein
VVREQNRTLLREIIEEAAAGARSADHANRLVGDYFGACMDEDAVEKAGTTVLDPIFSEIDRVGDARSLLAVTGALDRRGIEPLFGVDVFADLKDPGTNVAHLVQGGIGLPDRDYYVSDDPTKREILAAYEAHVRECSPWWGGARPPPPTPRRWWPSRPSSRGRRATARRCVSWTGSTTGWTVPASPSSLQAAGEASSTPPAHRTWLSNVRTPEFFAALESLVVATDPACSAATWWTAVDQCRRTVAGRSSRPTPSSTAGSCLDSRRSSRAGSAASAPPRTRSASRSAAGT